MVTRPPALHKKLVRAAFLLALMLILQSLRLFLPLPPFLSMFIVGSLLNACFLLALYITDTKTALLLAFLSPIIVFLQQALALPFFILPIAITNMAYVLVYKAISVYHQGAAILSAGLTRMLFLYGTSYFVFQIIDLPTSQSTLLQAAMSWPQLVTGIAGGILCQLLIRRLHPYLSK